MNIVVHNLRQVGIGTEIEKADLAGWISRVRQERFDLVLFRTTPWGMVMDAGCASGYFDARRRGGGTLGNIADPAFFDLCDRVLQTADPAGQEELYRRIQAVLRSASAGGGPLLGPKRLSGAGLAGRV